MIKSSKKFGWIKTDGITDGYHTFGELYEHRNLLFLNLCKLLYFSPQFQNSHEIWRKPIEDGWFLMGINLEAGKQVSYHLPESLWDMTNFVDVKNENEYVFDGHTSKDVVDRLTNLL